jgi:IclR family pca regulon transcriptional regulator
MIVEDVEIGGCGIAVPIRGTDGQVVAAINLSTNLARHSPKALVKTFLPQLIKAADRISQHLPAGLSAAAAGPA